MRFARQLLTACAASVALAAPAAASPLLVVDGDDVRTVEDPYLPADTLPPLSPRPAAGDEPGALAAKGPTVRRALLTLYRAKRITREQYDEYKALYQEARSVHKRLSGGRRNELQRVIANLEDIAADGRLSAGRVKPLFLILERNTEWWRANAFPASGARVSFAGDPVVFQYYRGEGLQIQPLANFGKANALWTACADEDPSTRCRQGALRELLDRLVELASRRGDFTTWEYYFRFGGGSPPWTSGLSQGTAIQALARASQLLAEPAYMSVAADALGAFERRAPTGVRLPVEEGNHYLIYSFNRRLLVLNGFLQAVTGLYDYWTISGDPRAQPLYELGEAAARAAVPRYDTGAWSLYSLAGRESDLGYHRLVRDFLRNLCTRTGVPVYCTTADSFTRYLLEHPKLELLRPSPRRVRMRKPVKIRFRLSKISRVQVHVSRGGKIAFERRVVNLGHGVREFTWTPRAAGRYRVRIEAADLRNHHTVETGTITVRRR